MNSKIGMCGMLLLVTLMSLSGAVTVQPSVGCDLNTNTMVIGFNAVQVSQLFSLGNSSSVTFNNLIISGPTLCNTTIAGSSSSGSVTFTSPIIPNTLYNIQNGWSILTLPIGTYTIVPPNAINYNSVFTPSNAQQNSIVTIEPNVVFNVVVAAEPIMSIGNVVLGYGGSYSSTTACMNSICSFNVIGAQQWTLNKNVSVKPGDIYSIPQINSTFSGQTINSLIDNMTFIDELYSAFSVRGCMPGYNLTLFDYAHNTPLTLCTRLNGQNLSWFALVGSYDYNTGNLTGGIGQAMLNGFKVADQRTQLEASNTLACQTSRAGLQNSWNSLNLSDALCQARVTGQTDAINFVIIAVPTAVGVVLALYALWKYGLRARNKKIKDTGGFSEKKVGQ